MLRTVVLSALVLLAGLPAVASAASAGVAGGVLTAQLGVPGYATATLKPPPCSETVHTTLTADRSFLRDPAGCVEIRTESEDVQPGPGCAYSSASFKPFTTVAICGLSGVSEVALHGTPGADNLTIGAQGSHAQVLRVVGGAGNDRTSVDGGAPDGAPVDIATGATLGPVPTGATFVEAGDGDDTIATKTPAASTIACGGGTDTLERYDEHHDLAADCEHFTGERPTTRPAGLPGRVGIEHGTLVVDASRYTASKVLGLSVSWETFRGQTGWSISEDARSSHVDTAPARALALATGPGCTAFVAEGGSARHFCPVSATTPVTVRGPVSRRLAMDTHGDDRVPVTAKIRVEGGRESDYIAFSHPFRMEVFCGPGLDTVLPGSIESWLKARPALGVHAFSEGDCEIPRGVKKVGRPAPVKVSKARGVVGDRRTFPLTGAGAIVTVKCPPGGLSCGGKMDMHVAGMRCGYLGTIPWTADRGTTAKVKLQFGTIEGELRCGSLLEPRNRIAANLRQRRPTKVLIVTRLAKSVKRWSVTVRR